MTARMTTPSQPEILQNLLLQPDPFKSMGLDGIHPRILKKLADVITKSLSMIFEWCWDSREVRSDWKLANLILIFKKCKKGDPRNYRLVNITSILVTHLADQGKPVDVIFLDFSKVFDTLSHRFLLDKMSSAELDKHVMWWVQHLVFGLVEPYEIPMAPGPEPVQIPLDGILSFRCVRSPSQPSVIIKFAEGDNLTIIFQQPWLCGEVPHDWKLANVTPIHKKGCKAGPGNCRLVSLASVPGRVMEQISLTAITQHLQGGQGIRPSHHGFRRGKSCLTNLISFHDQVTHLVDEVVSSLQCPVKLEEEAHLGSSIESSGSRLKIRGLYTFYPGNECKTVNSRNTRGSKKGHASKGLAGTLEGASDRPVLGWDGAWLDLGKVLRRLALPINWELMPKQVCDSGELAFHLSEGCFSYEDLYMRFSALCWGLASVCQLAMGHSQGVEAKTRNENIPSKTHDVPVQPIESGVQIQQKDNAVSETGAQATNQEVNAIPTTTSDVPVPSTGDGVQIQQKDNAVSETGVQATNQEVNDITATTNDMPVPSTGDGVQTQHEANAVSETQTQAEVNTALVHSVGTQTQATKPKITIAPIKKKKAWMKETAKPTDLSPQLERVEENEGEEEEPIPSTQEVADEGAVADKGAAARAEEMAVTMEGAMAREERVVTIEERAASREGEVVTRDTAHLMGLGTHPKESRRVSRKRKETAQVTQGRVSLDDLYSDYILRIPEDEKRKSAHFRKPEEEPFLPLQTQSSLGDVVPPPHTKPTLERIDDWEKPLSQRLKDYSLPPSIRYHEQPECRPQLAFTWRGMQYTWNRLPQGWKHSPVICHGLIQDALKKGEAPEHIQYIDDNIVWADTAEEVFKKGQKIIQILLKASFAIKKSKIKGPDREIQFLGVKWQDGHCQIPTNVINKIVAMAPPTNKKETQAFLGALGFWRMRIPEYSQIVSPLYFVTHKKNDFQWGPQQQQTFKQIKQKIAHAMALRPVKMGPDVKNVLYSTAGDKDEEEESVSRAEEAPPYNQLADEETRYALSTDSSCRIVEKSQKRKAAVWSPTRRVAEATEGRGELSQFGELKAIQLALNIAEGERWPRLYLYTDSWMIANAL
ncbi:hypothetical protein WISP_36872 [Willisornis vidua]|uniref:ribonuclease H n=1 Tax=Willisornis vidua TaxID=1566151 RepID=A0ABQ9DI80_9PASS|nr:hypothetical protein WISP_36872 [Willisornis vidua]